MRNNELQAASRREWLAFTCKTCGYERREPTQDAKSPLKADEVRPGVYVARESTSIFQRAPWWAFWR